MIEIDGSLGEGGGQLLRSSLTLAAITGQPFRMTRIRARRRPPGLKAQHHKAIEAIAAICGARVEGAGLGSQTLLFEPGPIAPGEFSLDIGTAGATSLVLQTILPPLSLATAASHVDLRGGTHARWSPCFEYLKLQWLAFVKKIGFDADLEMARAGFYPAGGGLIRAAIRPARCLRPIRLLERGPLRAIRGVSAVARLDPHIAERQRDEAVRRLVGHAPAFELEVVRLASSSPGTLLLLRAEFENSAACFFSLGERGKPAERVADEAVDELLEFLATGGAVDPYLADQLVVPLALAPGESALAVSRVTGHLTTNAEIVRRFLPVRIEIDAPEGRAGVIQIQGAGIPPAEPAESGSRSAVPAPRSEPFTV
jgi:RNA 3''-phosphate cyclase